MRFETELRSYLCRDCRLDYTTEVLLINGKEHVRVEVCPACSALITAKREKEVRDAILSDRLLAEQGREAQWAEICPVEFRLEAEGGKTVLQRMDAASPGWRLMLDWRFGSRGLIVRGVTGRCKTRAMWRLLRRLFESNHSIAAFTSAKFDRDCRDAGGNFTLSRWFDALAQVDALFIDDLGKAQWTSSTEAQFFDLIDERTRNGLPVLVTTNDDRASLAARISDDRSGPLVRRLLDYCDSIVL